MPLEADAQAAVVARDDTEGLVVGHGVECLHGIEVWFERVEPRIPRRAERAEPRVELLQPVSS